MEPSEYARVSDLFQRAIAMDPEERVPFLARECGDDEALRRQVESMLAHDEPSSADDPFDESHLARRRERLERISGDSAAPLPERLGPYQVLELLGTGGMGQVYRCRQDAPIRREVAVKLIKRGMDSEQLLERFAREREALERMEHAHIARVLDAGLSDDGRPYFAMELVDGDTITAHCDAHRLGVRDRLRLFVRVARAIHHAHQRGVLHRDIKPGNVLVEQIDGEPFPKVIDFGLARALEPDPAAFATRVGQVLGTPAYMSPEQANPGSAEVDSRADVYSLGVLLYELLTGTLPEQRTSVERPSSRFEASDETCSGLANKRSTSVRALRRELSGDLDWIVLTATDEDVERRYPSASELAADVERHLDALPVLASPPSRLYRIRKFYRRQRVLAWGGTAFVVLLMVALTVTAALYERARDAEGRAVALLDDERARNEIFRHMLVTAAPGEGGKDARVVDLLARGVEFTLANHADRTDVASSVLLSIGQTYRELGVYDEARASISRAVELLEAEEPQDPGDLSYAVNSLAILHKRTGDLEASARLYARAIELADSIPNPDDGTMRSIAASNYNLARMRLSMGNIEEAAAPMTRAFELQQRYASDDGAVMTFGHAGMAELLSAQGHDARALEHARASVEFARSTFGEEHPHLASSLTFLGAIRARTDAPEEAGPLFREALAIARRAFPAASPNLKTYVDRLLAHHIAVGELEEADELLAESAFLAEEHFGADSTEAAMTRGYLGQLRLAAGDPSGALEEFDACVPRLRDALGVEHPYVAALDAAVLEARSAATAASR